MQRKRRDGWRSSLVWSGCRSGERPRRPSFGACAVRGLGSRGVLHAASCQSLSRLTARTPCLLVLVRAPFFCILTSARRVVPLRFRCSATRAVLLLAATNCTIHSTKPAIVSKVLTPLSLCPRARRRAQGAEPRSQVCRLCPILSSLEAILGVTVSWKSQQATRLLGPGVSPASPVIQHQMPVTVGPFRLTSWLAAFPQPCMPCVRA